MGCRLHCALSGSMANRDHETTVCPCDKRRYSKPAVTTEARRRRGRSRTRRDSGYGGGGSTDVSTALIMDPSLADRPMAMSPGPARSSANGTATSTVSRVPPGAATRKKSRLERVQGPVYRSSPARSRPACLHRQRDLPTQQRTGAHRPRNGRRGRPPRAHARPWLLAAGYDQRATTGRPARGHEQSRKP